MREILEKLKKLSDKTQSKKYSSWLMLFLLFFLFLNIFFSQNISSIFFGLVNNDKKSTIEFLQKIRKTNNFSSQLNYFKNNYNYPIENEVFAKERQRKAKIKQFEQILDKNPQSRDILYSLYELYLQENDLKTAEKYFRLSKEIDPDINN